MLFDVNLQIEGIDEAFLEELEDLIEDYMVQFFLIHATDETSLSRIKELAGLTQSFYYTAPLGGVIPDDPKCVGLNCFELSSLPLCEASGLPLVFGAGIADEEMLAKLASMGKRGIVLDTLSDVSLPEGFFYGLSYDAVSLAPQEQLEKVQMERIVLQSNYPEHGYDELYRTVKILSDTLFRPEQSLIAHATKNTLKCFGLR